MATGVTWNWSSAFWQVTQLVAVKGLRERLFSASLHPGEHIGTDDLLGKLDKMLSGLLAME